MEEYHFTVLVPGNEIDLAVAEREAKRFLAPCGLSTSEVAKTIGFYLFVDYGWPSEQPQEILLFDRDWKILGIVEISWRMSPTIMAKVKPYRGEEE